MADLTTRVKVKRALGVPNAVTQHDDFIDTLLEVADQEIIAYCGMASLTQTTATLEAYNVPTTSENEIMLRNFPVISVAIVQSGGSTLDTDSYYVDNRSGVLRLTDYSRFFPEGVQQVKVTYTYGHAAVPADLSHAATLVCIAHFNATRHAGMKSEGANGYRYSLADGGMPDSAKSILARYRRAFPVGSV
jgi:hypothetical protein